MASRPAPTLLSVVRDGDTRALVREAADRAHLAVCYEALGLSDALEAAARLRPDLCLLDAAFAADLPLALARLGEDSPSTKTVVIVPLTRSEELLATVSGGARGYVSAGLTSESLARTLLDVLAGGFSIPRRLVGCLVDQTTGDAGSGPAPGR